MKQWTSLPYRLRRRYAQVCRMTRSRGFGVQSPWAYTVVTRVLMGRKGTLEARLNDFCREKGLQLQELSLTCAAQGRAAAQGPSLQVDAEQALAQATPQTALLVRGIKRTRQARQTWQRLTGDDRTGVAFDCFDFGLVFFDRRMHKRLYRVNWRQ